MLAMIFFDFVNQIKNDEGSSFYFSHKITEKATSLSPSNMWVHNALWEQASYR